jgi:hypothetical protein
MERNRMLDNEMPAKATPELIGSVETSYNCLGFLFV